MKKFWSLLNAVLFTVCVMSFALAGIAGTNAQVLVTLGICLVLWALTMIVLRMSRSQQQVYYIPKDVDQSVEEQEQPLEARMDDAYHNGR